MKKPLLHPTTMDVYRCQKKALEFLVDADINILFGRMLEASKSNHENYQVSLTWHSSPDYACKGRLSFNESRERLFDFSLGSFGTIQRDEENLGEELILFDKFIKKIISSLRERVNNTQELLFNHAEKHGNVIIIRDNGLKANLNSHGYYTYSGMRALLKALEEVGIEPDVPVIMKRVTPLPGSDIVVKVYRQIILITNEYENADWLFTHSDELKKAVESI